MDSHPYTCISCSLAFSSAGLQRSHYSTDHHRYNAQRKIAGLPPITVESFNQKVLERRQGSATAQTASEKLYCEVCRKNFASPNTYENHLKSRKHKEAEIAGPPAPREPVASPSVDIPTEPIQLSEPSVAVLKNASSGTDADAVALKKHLEKRIRHAHFIPSLQCLFCSHNLPNFPAKIKHMHASHGFFIPDRDYLVDEAGLVQYLAEVLSIWNACIFCGATFSGHPQESADDSKEKTEEEQAVEERKRSWRSLEAVRNHMTSKSHCKVPWDTEDDRLELSDFYDFTKSYDDDEDGNAAGWEDASDDGDSDADIIVEDGGAAPRRSRVQYGDTPYELLLPSGKRIGHRALRNIYKQNFVPAMQRQDAQMLKLTKHLMPQPTPAHAAGQSNALTRSNLDQMVLAGKLTKSAAKKASQPQQAQQQQERFRTKVGIRHNNQAHFRQELLQ